MTSIETSKLSMLWDSSQRGVESDKFCVLHLNPIGKSEFDEGVLRETESWYSNIVRRAKARRSRGDAG